MPPAEHIPVLLEESIRFLAPERGGLFVDCTLGLAGHAAAILETGPEAQLVGIDRDPQALEIARQRLEPYGSRVRLLRGEFSQLEQLLGELEEERGVPPLAGILADLGVSSLQLDRGERGFSFRFDGPLDMRMDTEGDLTAADVVNEYSEEELQRILREYGEERSARRMARAIVERRRVSPIGTTAELRELIASVKPPRHRRQGRTTQRIDPATRAFQALRIEVNQELSGLKRLLDQAMRMLDTDGRLVVISYHSLEDRIVKNAMRISALGEVDPITGRPRSETQLIEVLTRKPVRPAQEEVNLNPRSRSARLRAARGL